jgi:hypothetical protein
MDIDIVIESTPCVNQESELISHPLDSAIISVDINDHSSIDESISNTRYNSFISN